MLVPPSLIASDSFNQSIMGLLSFGEPLSWTETKLYAEYIRDAGIRQFINLYNLCKDKTSHVLKFGDEVIPMFRI